MARDPIPTAVERSATTMAKMTPGTLRGGSRIATPGRAPGRPKRIPITAPLTSTWTFSTSQDPVPDYAPNSDDWLSDVTADALSLAVAVTYNGEIASSCAPVEVCLAENHGDAGYVVVGPWVVIPPDPGTPQTLTVSLTPASIVPSVAYFFKVGGLTPDIWLTNLSLSVTFAGSHSDVSVGWSIPS